MALQSCEVHGELSLIIHEINLGPALNQELDQFHMTTSGSKMEWSVAMVIRLINTDVSL